MSIKTITRKMQETVEVSECDVAGCGTQAKKYCLNSCQMCRMDFCSECAKGGHYGDEAYSDDENWYCRKCWAKGEKHREKMLKANEEYEKSIDAEMEAWGEEAEKE